MDRVCQLDPQKDHLQIMSLLGDTDAFRKLDVRRKGRWSKQQKQTLANIMKEHCGDALEEVSSRKKEESKQALEKKPKKAERKQALEKKPKKAERKQRKQRKQPEKGPKNASGESKKKEEKKKDSKSVREITQGIEFSELDLRLTRNDPVTHDPVTHDPITYMMSRLSKSVTPETITTDVKVDLPKGKDVVFVTRVQDEPFSLDRVDDLVSDTNSFRPLGYILYKNGEHYRTFKYVNKLVLKRGEAIPKEAFYGDVALDVDRVIVDGTVAMQYLNNTLSSNRTVRHSITSNGVEHLLRREVSPRGIYMQPEDLQNVTSVIGVYRRIPSAPKVSVLKVGLALLLSAAPVVAYNWEKKKESPEKPKAEKAPENAPEKKAPEKKAPEKVPEKAPEKPKAPDKVPENAPEKAPDKPLNPFSILWNPWNPLNTSPNQS